MPTQKQPQQQQLSSSTIHRLLNDPSLAPLLDSMKSTVYTQAGYGQVVLHQFLGSDAVQRKLEEWRCEDLKNGDCVFAKDANDAEEELHSEAGRRFSLGLQRSFLSLFEAMESHDADGDDDGDDDNDSLEDSINCQPLDTNLISTKLDPSNSQSCSMDSVVSTTTSPSSQRRPSFLDSLSSLNLSSIRLNLNLKEECDTKSRYNDSSSGGSTSTSSIWSSNSRRLQRQSSLNCPLRSSRKHAESADRIQCLERMI